MLDSECEHCLVDANGIQSADIPCICGPGVICNLCTHLIKPSDQKGT